MHAAIFLGALATAACSAYGAHALHTTGRSAWPSFALDEENQLGDSCAVSVCAGAFFYLAWLLFGITAQLCLR
eukprot:5511548-Prymnesium_polylepis.1